MVENVVEQVLEVEDQEEGMHLCVAVFGLILNTIRRRVFRITHTDSARPL